MSALEMCLHWLKAGIRRLSLWTSLCLACLLAASTAMGDSGPLRYLFLVETSSATDRHKQEILSAVSARLASGLQGQMRPGEMFVVWTYGQAVATDRYLPAAWNWRTRELLATRTARALAELWFSGEARLDQALAEALRVAKNLDALTILIVNDGSSRIVGTPFDEQINAASLAGARDGNTNVLVTTLLARRGQAVGWTVEPAEASRGSLAPAQSPAMSNQPAAVREAGSAGKQLIPQPTASSPVPSAAALRPGNQAMPTPINQTAPLSTARPNLGTPLTNLDAAAAQKPVRGELPATTVLAPDDGHVARGTPVNYTPKANTSSLAAKPEVSQPVPSNPVLREERMTPAAVPSSEQVRRPPAAARRADSPAPAAGVVLAEPSSGARKFLVIGFALLICALAGLVYFVCAKDQREQSSLISKSIAARK